MMACKCRETPSRIFVQGLSQVHKVEAQPTSLLRLSAPMPTRPLHRTHLTGFTLAQHARLLHTPRILYRDAAAGRSAAYPATGSASLKRPSSVSYKASPSPSSSSSRTPFSTSSSSLVAGRGGAPPDFGATAGRNRSWRRPGAPRTPRRNLKTPDNPKGRWRNVEVDKGLDAKPGVKIKMVVARVSAERREAEAAARAKKAKAKRQPRTKTMATQKPATKPATKPKAKRATKPKTKRATRSETKPVAKADTEPAMTVDTEPVTKADMEPVTKADTEPVAKADTESAMKADTEPAMAADMESVTKADAEPVTQADMEKDTDKDIKLAAKPDAKDTKPATKSDTEPVTKKDNKSAPEPAPEPAVDPLADEANPQPEKPHWRIQKEALKEKFPDGWKPIKRLSPDALAGIRALHAQFPDTYDTPTLASKFEVSIENIRRILKSKWTPKPEEEARRQAKWFDRGKEVWERKAALGLKPPKKWRDEGITREPGFYTWRKGAVQRNRDFEEEEDRKYRSKFQGKTGETGSSFERKPRWEGPGARKPEWQSSRAPRPDWEGAGPSKSRWEGSRAPRPEWQGAGASKPRWQDSRAPRPDWEGAGASKPRWEGSRAPRSEWQDEGARKSKWQGRGKR